VRQHARWHRQRLASEASDRAGIGTCRASRASGTPRAQQESPRTLPGAAVAGPGDDRVPAQDWIDVFGVSIRPDDGGALPLPSPNAELMRELQDVDRGDSGDAGRSTQIAAGGVVRGLLEFASQKDGISALSLQPSQISARCTSISRVAVRRPRCLALSAYDGIGPTSTAVDEGRRPAPGCSSSKSRDAPGPAR
jgi:hypothetical protein